MVNLIDEIYRSRKDLNIIVIYITEAHAADVWPIGMSAGTVNYAHQKIENRIECIKKFKSEYNLELPIYADNMDNTFETEYAAWPFRYYCVIDARLYSIGQPSESTFDIADLLDLINEL